MAKQKKVAEAAASDNTVIWNSWASTEPQYLKSFKKTGGFSGLSIDPVYRIRSLTERFGPCGIGWGFVQEDQWSDGGSGAYVVYVRGHLWYMHEGERVQTMSHTGGTICDRAPDEAYKMAETDALGKCCLDLGMAADVYMGVHDSDKYQDDRPPTYRPNQADAGRRPAGTNPSNAPATATPALPIAPSDVGGVKEAILKVDNDPDAYALCRLVFDRMLASSDLDAETMRSLAEAMLTRRSQLVPAEMLPSFKKAAAAFVKKGWLSTETAKRYVSLCERRLGIAPGSEPAGQ